MTHCQRDDDTDEEIDTLLRQSTQYSNSSNSNNNPSVPLPLPPYRYITSLDLGNCSLSSLPPQMPELLPHITTLFLSNNHFTEMPPVIGQFRQLEMIAFKGNQMTRIHPDCFVPGTFLRWIILTNNQITHIPHTIRHVTKLQKFMLSGNRLTVLPDELGTSCHNLELIRLACNQLSEPPLFLLQLQHLPKLRWVALGGNPFLESTTHSNTASLTHEVRMLRDIDESSGTILGRGASGMTRAIEIPVSSLYSTTSSDQDHRIMNEDNDDQSMTVAIKTYHGDMTSDGTPELERHIALLVSHIQQQQQQWATDRTVETNMMPPSCDSKTGFIHVYGQCDPTGSLVMEYLHDYAAMADPPSFSSCTRDVYTNDHGEKKMTPWSRSDTIRFVNVMLHSLQVLHTHGITHGDLYGHNILVCRGDNDNDNDPAPIQVRLSDFGASFQYDTLAEYGKCLEQIELRAFQVLLQEVRDHYYQEDDDDLWLSNLIQQCPTALTFRDLYIDWQKQQLKEMAKAFETDVE